jgi:ribosomal protein L11 methyltransferase
MSLLILGLVFFQASYLGRHTIRHYLAKTPLSIQEPALTAWTALDRTICQWLPCQEKALKDFSAWAIEYANLETYPANHKKKGPDTVKPSSHTGLLQLQIRNQLNAYVAWPSLVISITDANDVIIAEILAEPQDWLPANIQSTGLDSGHYFSKGATPRLEVSTNIPLALPEQAAGYRVRVTYASQK